MLKRDIFPDNYSRVPSDSYKNKKRTNLLLSILIDIDHPAGADRSEGCNKQNKLFKERFGLMTQTDFKKRPI